MKSLVDILVRMLHDCSIQCGANPILDLRTIERRTKDEGDSFLTITLPTFSQALERGLELGRLSPALFPAFRFRRGTCLPRFLGGFMERIFGPDGVLLENASSDCVLAVRQICLFAKKLKSPCSARRQRAAERSFLETESELRCHAFDSDDLHHFRGVSRIVWTDLFNGLDVSSLYGEITPKHGPGLTRDGTRGNRKYLIPSWPYRVEKVFPFTEFGIASIRNFDTLDDHPVTFLSTRDEEPVKVVFVPKTMKTPRVIAMEPTCMQYMQQSLASVLKRRIEHSSSYMKGRVNFTRQDINARLALSSSKDSSLATIDLSEASDRVSSSLVRDMLKSIPEFSRMIFACRSTRAELPSGKIIPLRKFASMGSALCFPIESVVFFIIIVSFRIRNAGVRITPRNVSKYSEGVLVYGDDIIVPTNEAPLVCDYLERFALKVNRHKSFWTGKFRESCGVDAFNGTDVTPTYARRSLPTNKADVRGLLSLVALANQLYFAGRWTTARFLRQKAERLLGPLPSVGSSTSRLIERLDRDVRTPMREYPGLGWSSFSNAESFSGWDPNLQTLRDKRWVVVPKRVADPLTGDAALLKCFGIIGRETYDARHLLTSVRSGNLALKRRWTTL